MDLASTLIAIGLCLGIAWSIWFSCCRKRRRAPVVVLPLPAAVPPFVPEEREPSMPSLPSAVAAVTVV